jgi:hypothetical protein
VILGTLVMAPMTVAPVPSDSRGADSDRAGGVRIATVGNNSPLAALVVGELLAREHGADMSDDLSASESRHSEPASVVRQLTNVFRDVEAVAHSSAADPLVPPRPLRPPSKVVRHRVSGSVRRIVGAR